MKTTKNKKRLSALFTKADKIKKDKKVKGFTLVELIVVIAIIGILAVILVPTLFGEVKDAKQTTLDDTAAKIASQAGIEATKLESSGTSVAVNKTYKSTDTDALVTNIKASLNIKSSASWEFTMDANGKITSVTYTEGSETGNYPKS